jgi:hypothetical protein
MGDHVPLMCTVIMNVLDPASVAVSANTGRKKYRHQSLKEKLKGEAYQKAIGLDRRMTSSRTVALEFTQFPTSMSSRRYFCG